MVKNTHITELPPTIQLGPRLEADIRRRTKELESRWPGKRTVFEWAELARLRE